MRYARHNAWQRYIVIYYAHATMQIRLVKAHTDQLCPPFCLHFAEKGDPEDATMSDLAKAAADKADNRNETRFTGPALKEVLDLTDNDKRAQLLDKLSQLVQGAPEAQSTLGEIQRLLAEAPLFQTDHVDDQEAQQRIQAKQVLEEKAAYDLLKTLVDDQAEKIITFKRRLDKDMLEWKPATSPNKLIKTLTERLPKMDAAHMPV